MRIYVIILSTISIFISYKEADAKAREGENEAKWYEIIVNVTTTMYETHF